MNSNTQSVNGIQTYTQDEPTVLADAVMQDEFPDASNFDHDSNSPNSDIPSVQSYPEKYPRQSINNASIPSTNQEMGAPLQKTRTRFFSDSIAAQRRNVIFNFLLTVFLFAIFIFSILVMFWGSNAYTTRYYYKVRLLAVIQDDIIEGNVVPTASLSSVVKSLIGDTPGDWDIYNTTSFSDKWNLSSEDEINDKIIDRIYHEYYWIALNVKPNVTSILYNSITNESAPLFNSTDLFEVVYESARDGTNIVIGMLPIIKDLEAKLKEYYTTQYLPSLINNITETVQKDTINFQSFSKLAQLDFYYNDYREDYRRGLVSPTEVGLIFSLLLTIFQFMIYGPVNQEMAKLIKPREYIIFRIILSWVTFFFSSLFYCTVSAIYKIDFTRAFGRGGFVVYWMSTWIFMVACGGANENVIGLIFLYKPEYLGFWILFFIVINSSTSFFPFVLNNYFYRFGYMMPMHNVLDIYRVIFYDITRIKMGRNYGVLCAWIVLNTLLAPFVIRHIGLTMKKRAQDAAKILAENNNNNNNKI